MTQAEIHRAWRLRRLEPGLQQRVQGLASTMQTCFHNGLGYAEHPGGFVGVQLLDVAQQ